MEILLYRKSIKFQLSVKPAGENYFIRNLKVHRNELIHSHAIHPSATPLAQYWTD